MLNSLDDVKFSRKEELNATGRFVMNLLDRNEELQNATDDLKSALKLLADENKSSELLNTYSSKYDKNKPSHKLCEAAYFT